MKTTHPRKQSGSSLVVVISVLATLMVIVGVAAEYTYTVNRHVQRSNTLQSAVAVGDSCIDILFSNWRAICSVPGSVNIPQKTSAFSTIPLPVPSQLNLPSVTNFAKRGTNLDPTIDEYFPDYTISNYKVIAVGPEWNALASADTTPVPMLGQIAAALTSVAPTTSLVYNYIASADVTLPALGPTGTVVARVRRVFQKQQLSPWNFAIFYEDDLEIHPGPLLTVTGWVHTNSDLYTGHDTLTFADKVTYGSDWSIGFRPGETYHAGDVPASPHYPLNLPPAQENHKLDPFGTHPVWDLTDANPNNDSWRELIEQPVAGFTDPLAAVGSDPSQRYYDQAAIKILIDNSGNATIKKLDGTTVTSSSTGLNLKLYTAVTNALTATAQRSIQDNREAAPVRLTTLDIGSIVTSLNASSGSSSYIDSPLWNGIIYITDTSATNNTLIPPPPPVHRGIRLKNGKVLPTDGVTIASANPVYIQGDYNTGTGTVPSNIPAPLNDPTTPQSSGYTRQPAAVLADAVNILSNNWDDTRADLGDPLSARVATNTTVNTAIVAGIVTSSPVGGDGSYSGGAENFPRFLESWTNTKITYYGSMVELFNSKQAIGEWSMPNIYDAPDRQWYFDNTFKTRPPRGSLMIYTYIKGKWSVF